MWARKMRWALAALSICGTLEHSAIAQAPGALTASETERWRREIRKCNDQALAAIKAGRYGDALGWAQTSVRLSDLTPDMPVAEQAQCSALLASIFEHLARPREAIASYRKAVTIFERDSSVDRVAVSNLRRQLAPLLFEQGDQEEARKEARRAFVTAASANDPRALVSELASLGAWLDQNGDREAAQATYVEALQLLPNDAKSAEQSANLELALGSSLQISGRTAEAESAFRRELAHTRQLPAPDPSRVALALANIGALELRAGKCADAHRDFEQALTLFAGNHPSVVSTRELFALALTCEGDVAAALKQIGLGSPMFANPAARSGAVYARFLDTFVTVAWAGHDVDGTIRLLQAANLARKPVTTQILQARPEAGRRAYLDAMAGRVNSALSFALNEAKSAPQAASASYEALIDFKGRLLESTIDRAVERQKSTSSTLNSLSTVQSRLDEISRIEHKRDPQVALRDIPLVSLQSIQGRLGPKDALIEFTYYVPADPRRPGPPAPEGHYAAFVVRNQGAPRAVDLGPAVAINRRITPLIEQLVSKDRAYKSRAEELYAKLFAPVAHLLGDAVNLYIAPDTELALLPFAALADANHEYLVKRFQITYLTSGRDLLRMNQRIIPRSQPQLYAAPNYGALERNSARGPSPSADSLLLALGISSFPALEGALKESNVLAPILGKLTHVHTGNDATESSLKSVRGPSILHVATHGFYVDGPATSGSGGRSANRAIKIAASLPVLTTAGAATPTPTPTPTPTLPPLQRSGLALAGANRGTAAGDDGILTAEEVLEMDLQGTQLVTLSACDTARGKASVGEGVWGLRRALAAVGAETQVITLWELEDKPTVATMKGYYTRLRKGEGRSAALRSTQLAMIDQHPYFWASFIVAGDPSPLHDSIIMPGIDE